MKGLLIKDFSLAFRNTRTIFMLVMICAVMSLSLDAAFIAGYAVMLMGTIGLGTLTYDEFDNGFSFLMSLPVDAKSYVKEKFLFCLLCELAGAAVGMLFSLGASLIKGQPVEPGSTVAFIAGIVPVMFMMISVMLVIQLKYGVEKSRVALMVLYGFFAILAVIFATQKEKAGPALAKFVLFLESQSPVLLAGGCILICLAVCALMYLLSVRIMKNREY